MSLILLGVLGYIALGIILSTLIWYAAEDSTPFTIFLVVVTAAAPLMFVFTAPGILLYNATTTKRR